MTDFRAYVQRSNFSMMSVQVAICNGPHSDMDGRFSQAVKK